VDNYDIAGGGIITAGLSDNQTVLNDHIHQRELHWDKGLVSAEDRCRLFGHRAKFVVISGGINSGIVAKQLERHLVDSRNAAYYLGPASLADGLDADVIDEQERHEEQMRRLGELARILTDAGAIFITAFSNADAYDLKLLARLTAPNDFLHVSLNGGESDEDNRLSFGENLAPEEIADVILQRLKKQEIIAEYMI
jgi:bifunctional enzyme CysN/CysC